MISSLSPLEVLAVETANTDTLVSGFLRIELKALAACDRWKGPIV